MAAHHATHQAQTHQQHRYAVSFRHRRDLSGAHSPSIELGILIAVVLVATEGNEVPRVNRIRRVLRAIPVEKILKVIKLSDEGDMTTCCAAQLAIKQLRQFIPCRGAIGGGIEAEAGVSDGRQTPLVAASIIGFI